MSGTFVTREDDYGYFQPGGLFDYLYDEGVDRLPPPGSVEIKNDSRLRKVSDGSLKYNNLEVLQFIDEARSRPKAPKDRLSDLTSRTNLEREWNHYKRSMSSESVLQHWNNMLRTMVDVMNDLLEWIPSFEEDTTTSDKPKPTLKEIFYDNDRLFYLGIYILLIGLIWKTLS